MYMKIYTKIPKKVLTGFFHKRRSSLNLKQGTYIIHHNSNKAQNAVHLKLSIQVLNTVEVAIVSLSPILKESL